ncbi:class I SAM-dependent methyltransferase [Variovorax robiniae]|uniref:class I SAM-dependent methyltransferase n=1 Tax=Variovorax robiniae TaxID=1836199 RepID=UPI003BF4A247
MTWNSLWDDVFRSRPWGQYPGEDVVRFVARNFYGATQRSAVRLLEVGCGTGANLWFMAREGFCVHGIDGAATGVQIAQNRLDKDCPGWRDRGGRIDIGNMYPLDYPDAHFDGVFDVAAICYCDWDLSRRTYAELARVTRPGGRLFARTFARGCWGEGTGQAVGRQIWHCSEGPLANLGATRFTSHRDVPSLFTDWHIDAVGENIAKEDEGSPSIHQLLVQATRR